MLFAVEFSTEAITIIGVMLGGITAAVGVLYKGQQALADRHIARLEKELDLKRTEHQEQNSLYRESVTSIVTAFQAAVNKIESFCKETRTENGKAIEEAREYLCDRIELGGKRP